jgi:hypothetical protein
LPLILIHAQSYPSGSLADGSGPAFISTTFGRAGYGGLVACRSCFWLLSGDFRRTKFQVLRLMKAAV